jgi:hypothetical protein
MIQQTVNNWKSPLSSNLKDYSSVEMENGEMCIKYFRDAEFIILQKCTGTILNNILNTGVIQELLKNNKMKFMFINRQKNPMFLDPKNNMMYFSDNLSKKNSVSDEDTPMDETHSIWYTGHYNVAIMDDDSTIMKEKSNNYYIIGYCGGNSHDGTEHFITTDELLKLNKYNEYLIRFEIKTIIQSILQLYLKKKKNHTMSTEEVDCLFYNLLLLYIISLILILVYFM